MVEMTSLQHHGRYYALHSGETEAVAQAIRALSAALCFRLVPESQAGLVVGLADRLDTLSGLFAAGLAPTGTKDPFAQRRAALGLVQILALRDLDFDLQEALRLAGEGLPIPATEKSQVACLEFIVGRLRSYLLEQNGFRYDVVDAVLAEQQANPAGVLRGVKALTAWVQRSDWSTILPAYARCVRITREKETFAVHPAVR